MKIRTMVLSAALGLTVLAGAACEPAVVGPSQTCKKSPAGVVTCKVVYP